MTRARLASATPPVPNDAPDCPNCAALRGTSRLLAEAALFLIDRNAALSAEVARLRARRGGL